MSKNIQQLKYLKNITLSSEERDLLRGRLEALMAMQPLPERRQLEVEAHRSWFMWWRLAPIAMASFVLIFFSTLSLSAQALPGQPLYGIKTDVREPLQKVLAGSDKVALESQFMAERVEEAKKLQKRGALTPESVTLLENKIEEHATQISKQIASQSNTVVPESTSTDTTQLAKIAGQAAGHKSTLQYLSGVMLPPHNADISPEAANGEPKSAELTPQLISAAQEEIKTMQQVINELDTDQEMVVDDKALEYLDSQVKNLEQIINADPTIDGADLLRSITTSEEIKTFIKNVEQDK